MASGLKHLKSHIKAVGNIQKVTGSMKMVAAARFIQAEKSVSVARPIGLCVRRFYDSFSQSVKQSDWHHFLATFTSDRGLCGGVHNKVCKKGKQVLKDNPGNYSFFCIGEKSRSILAFDFPKLVRIVVNGIGHRTPTFQSASEITLKLINYTDFYHVVMVYPIFKNMLSFNIQASNLYSYSVIADTEFVMKYEVDRDDFQSYVEFLIASQVFSALCDTYLVELSARINAMSSATKNAGKLKKTLMLQYNRVRQALVTKELMDIIGGASVIIKKKK
ncbi:ATP synthase subunit gamma, mitochondrial-like [Cimex lectularius]|uniref:ATP synthase subunit gamma n=1 Tax=Cimex lectularius TaxID=79782 RepID=A0A8I6RK77_CIMLE|nr:ATP synthase subunit gamma, mitochondrial-like [Cimex lectularius]